MHLLPQNVIKMLKYTYRKNKKKERQNEKKDLKCIACAVFGIHAPARWCNGSCGYQRHMRQQPEMEA